MNEKPSPVIYIVGTDGSGKTTMVHGISEARPDARVGYLGERFAANRRSGRLLHRAAPLRYLHVRYVLPTILHKEGLRLMRAGDGPVVVDRAPMFPFQPDARPGLRERYLRALPPPALVLLLDGAPATLYARKKEGRPEDVARNAGKARAVLGDPWSGRVAVLDATRPAAENLKDALDLMKRAEEMQAQYPLRNAATGSAGLARTLARAALHGMQSTERSLGERRARKQIRHAARAHGIVVDDADWSRRSGLGAGHAFRVTTRAQVRYFAKGLGSPHVEGLLRKSKLPGPQTTPKASAKIADEAEKLRQWAAAGFSPEVVAWGRRAYVAEWLDATPLPLLRNHRLGESIGALGALAVDFHAQGFFHGDLHVDNVMVDAKDRLWLIDPGPGLGGHLTDLEGQAWDWAMLLGSLLARTARDDLVSRLYEVVAREGAGPPASLIAQVSQRYADSNAFIAQARRWIHTHHQGGRAT